MDDDHPASPTQSTTGGKVVAAACSTTESHGSSVVSTSEPREQAISLEQLEREAGGLIESLCKVRLHFKQVNLRLEEYVVLKIMVMTCFKPSDLNRDPDSTGASSNGDRVSPILINSSTGDDNDESSSPEDGCDAINDIQRKYLNVLRTWLRTCGGYSEHGVRKRLQQLVACLDKSEEAANQLLHSKMFYVPFLLLHN